jgi:para-aminobenzoate synthetase
MRALLIDNHDSFTGNLARLWWQVTGRLPLVVPHDAARWADLAGEGFDAVLISPGPGRPDTPADFRLGAEVLRVALGPGARLPVLGICLGHQGIAAAAGGQVVRAGEPRHGRTSPVHHQGHPLFQGVASPFEAVRYHSLVAAEPLPQGLAVLARAGDDDAVMALGHASAPVYGLQFHPESILTPDGARLLANFAGLAGAGLAGAGLAGVGTVAVAGGFPPVMTPPPAGLWPAGLLPEARPEGWAVLRRSLAHGVDIEAVADLVRRLSGWSVWLDPADGDPGAFPVLIPDQGPLARRLSYRVPGRRMTVEDGAGRHLGQVTGDAFDLLGAAIDRFGPLAPLPDGAGGTLPGPGFYGYLGYELAELSTGVAHHPSCRDDLRLILADRLLVARPDAAGRHMIEAVMLVPAGDAVASAAAHAWAEAWAGRLAPVHPLPQPDMTAAALPVEASHDRAAYRRRIRAAQRLIRMGQSFEICLTTRFRVRRAIDPWQSYRRLRRTARAPLMAWLGFGDMSVLSGSPELFLDLDPVTGVATAKPIKGTVRRAADPAEDAALAASLTASEKERAENLMIVDLMRNDLGRVARPDGVAVPVLFGIESFATVHQLVSTVTARLASGPPGRRAAGLLRACFPGGSMTGAPKRRTLEIIHRLEGEARGIYSGAIGRIGLDGSMRLSMVIRTVVIDRDGALVGAGGAITHLSDPDAEIDEVALKASAPLAALFPPHSAKA